MPCCHAQVLYKTGKAFATRGLDKCAENCELLRGEVEEFKKFVPLVQVRVVCKGQWAVGSWQREGIVGELQKSCAVIASEA